MRLLNSFNFALNSEPIEEDIYTAMECDEKLAEKLGLDVNERETDEEDNEEEKFSVRH